LNRYTRDIGTTSVKLVRLKKTLRDFQVLSFASEEINAEEENHDEALRDALQRLIENNPLNGHIVVSNLPMERSILRVIKFPFADIEKIAEAIPFEAQENIPFNIDDLVMDFQMLPGSDPEEGRISGASTMRLSRFFKTFEP
jgi:Tfp pilus assembly PilM family ATPase